MLTMEQVPRRTWSVAKDKKVTPAVKPELLLDDYIKILLSVTGFKDDMLLLHIKSIKIRCHVTLLRPAQSMHVI
jgi:hypothetical protein